MTLAEIRLEMARLRLLNDGKLSNGKKRAIGNLLTFAAEAERDRDALRRVVDAVTAWRDRLAKNRGGWDSDIAAKLTEILAGAAAGVPKPTCQHGKTEQHQNDMGALGVFICCPPVAAVGVPEPTEEQR